MAGLYTNKSYTEEEQWWYLKPDSTFVYTRFSNSYLTSFGYGKWSQLPGGSIKFAFAPNDTLFLTNAGISVSYRLVQPYDSVFINGQIEPRRANDFRFVITLNNKLFVISDSLGAFKIVTVRELQPTSIQIFHFAQGGIIVPLSNNVNKHVLNIKLPLRDSTSCFPAYSTYNLSESAFQSSVIIMQLAHLSTQKSQHYLRKKDDQYENFVNRLTQVPVRQPLLSKELAELLLYLK
ncbi:MAG: hypothetical protein EAZ47_06205 [Bacteroidetes bacterium]|nr:MAG: hypothetical protein EAY72_02630 [Bacteroidota bacterium]TAF93547.1 MAG: hypothetical protein EAZ47_06205 [Bacteroidota bacterium]